MSDELMRLILAAANPKGQNTKADYSRLFDSMLGVLSNTYTAPPSAPGMSDADMLYQYAPTLQSINDSPYYDDASIERMIANDLLKGTPTMVVKQQVREMLAAQGISGDDTTTGEYESLVDKLAGEVHSLNVASSRERNKAAASVADNVFSRAGLPQPGEQYDVDAILGSAYAKLAERYAPMQVTNRGKSQMDEMRRLVGRTRAGARKEAELSGGGEFGKSVPNYGAAMLNTLKSMIPFAGGDGGWGIEDAIKRDLMEGTSLGGTPAQRAARRAKSVSDQTEATYLDLMGGPSKGELGEAERMLTRSLAQSGRLSESVGRNVPVRTELVNQQRAERAANVAEGMREMLARRLATTGQSPLMDALTKRAIFIQLAGG